MASKEFRKSPFHRHCSLQDPLGSYDFSKKGFRGFTRKLYFPLLTGVQYHNSATHICFSQVFEYLGFPRYKTRTFKSRWGGLVIVYLSQNDYRQQASPLPIFPIAKKLQAAAHASTRLQNNSAAGLGISSALLQTSKFEMWRKKGAISSKLI